MHEGWFTTNSPTNQQLNWSDLSVERDLLDGHSDNLRQRSPAFVVTRLWDNNEIVHAWAGEPNATTNTEESGRAEERGSSTWVSDRFVVAMRTARSQSRRQDHT